MGANGVLLFTLVFYAAVIYGAAQLVKYFIRYGIDYYFKKLEEYDRQKEEMKASCQRERVNQAEWLLHHEVPKDS